MADRVQLSAEEWRERAIYHAWVLRALLAQREPETGSFAAAWLDEARDTLRAGGAEGTFIHRSFPLVCPPVSPPPGALKLVTE